MSGNLVETDKGLITLSHERPRWLSKPDKQEAGAPRVSSIDRRQLKQIFHEREHGAVHSLDFRTCGLDHVVFVRRVGAAAMAEAEMAGGFAERITGEDVTGPRACAARPDQGINPTTAEDRDLSADQRRATRR